MSDKVAIMVSSEYHDDEDILYKAKPLLRSDSTVAFSLLEQWSGVCMCSREKQLILCHDNGMHTL